MLKWSIIKNNLLILDENNITVANVVFNKKITEEDICCVSKRALKHCNECIE